MGKLICSVEVCDRAAVSHGWCQSHYMWWRNHGEIPTHAIKPRGKQICTVEDCTRFVKGHGLCEAHYARQQRLGEVREDTPIVVKAKRGSHIGQVCSLHGCDKPLHSGGYCTTHYMRVWRDGHPGVAEIREVHDDAEESFWSRVDRRGDDECWPWTGRLNRKGYAEFWEGSGNKIAAYRWAYERFVGEIPDGLTIDHTCHNEADPPCLLGDACPHRRCVNFLRHLKVETIGDNIRNAKAARRRNRTHCRHGHELTPENTRFTDTGAKACRMCDALKAAKYRSQKSNGNGN